MQFYMRCYLSFFLLTFASQACSESPLALSTGPQLKNALSGNTVEGSMQAPGRYTEFYAQDGTVLAKDYKAIGRIEGNNMIRRTNRLSHALNERTSGKGPCLA